MTEYTPRTRPRPRPRRRRRRRTVIVVVLVAGVILFGVGVACGEALHDNPVPSSGQSTDTRTLVPGTLPPEQATVTVTVTTPGA